MLLFNNALCRMFLVKFGDGLCKLSAYFSQSLGNGVRSFENPSIKVTGFERAGNKASLYVHLAVHSIGFLVHGFEVAETVKKTCFLHFSG